MPANVTIPRLEDPPLLLRSFLDEDIPVIQEAATDPLIPLTTTVPTTTDAAAALAFIERQRSRAASGQGYSFAVADSTTGEAVGQIGLWLRDLSEGRATVGYWIAASRRRQGWAGRALAVVSSWGLQLPGVHRLQLYVEPWNAGSCRAAEGAGYQREGLLRSWQQVGDQRRDMYMYSLVKSDGYRASV